MGLFIQRRYKGLVVVAQGCLLRFPTSDQYTFSRRYPREWLPSHGRAQPESGHMYALNKVVLRLSIPDMSYFPPAYENIVPTPSLLSSSIRIEWGTRPSCILALSTPWRTASTQQSTFGIMPPRDDARFNESRNLRYLQFWNQSAVVPGTFISPRTSVKRISFFAFKATASFSAAVSALIL